MASPVQTGLTYDDLASFPDDHLRRELIGGAHRDAGAAGASPGRRGVADD